MRQVALTNGATPNHNGMIARIPWANGLRGCEKCIFISTALACTIKANELSLVALELRVKLLRLALMAPG